MKWLLDQFIRFGLRRSYESRCRRALIRLDLLLEEQAAIDRAMMELERPPTGDDYNALYAWLVLAAEAASILRGEV